MAVKLNQAVRNALEQSQLIPQLALSIDGIPDIFSTTEVKRYIRIGDPGLKIDGSWTIGGLTDVENQASLISFSEGGTSTQIRQTLSPDSGAAGTVSSVQVTLTDQNGQISRLISPGQVLTDILGAKAKLHFIFQGGGFPEDAITVFRGVVTDVVAGPAAVTLVVDHPDTLKRQKCYRQVTTRIPTAIPVGVIGGLTIGGTLTGYLENDVLTITGGNGDARIKITGVTGGVVSKVDLESGGSGYEIVSNVATTGGSGSGLTVSITGIAALDPFETTIPVDNSANFLLPIEGPDGSVDDTFEAYVRIGDELIQYTGVEEGKLTGCTRGARDTIPAIHEPAEEVTSFYLVRGPAMQVAMKLMLSGKPGEAYSENVSYSAVNHISTTRRENVIYFEQIDVNDAYGVVAGDYVTLSGSTENDFVKKRIREVGVVPTGSFILIEDVELIDDAEASGTLAFYSQFNSWPDGLGVHPEYVDVEEHQRLHRLFLSSFEYEFYLKDTLDGKEFLEREVYRPAAAYAVPRKARSSVAYTIDPIPGTNIRKLEQNNIVTPSRIKLRRTISKNFYNQIAYRFDEHLLSDGLATNIYSLNADSLSRIPVGIKTLQIESRGMRSYLSGESLAIQASNRKLGRFSLGAEHFDSIEVQLAVGFEIEIGDMVLFDTSGLHIVDTKTGTRTGYRRLFEVINKTLSISTGRVTLSLLDTNIDGGIRYGLISPASRVKSATSAREFLIEPAFPSAFGPDEYRKWSHLTDPAVRIRNTDFTVVGLGKVESIEANQVVLQEALEFTPEAGMLMEFADYSACSDEQRLLYVFITGEEFPDGSSPYSML